MFRSYSFGFDTKIHSIDIIDDDFFYYAETDGGDYNNGMAECLGYHIIKCYEERSLPVVSNLMKAFLYHEKTQNFDLNFIIWVNEQYNPLYPKYAAEIEKLLLLI